VDKRKGIASTVVSRWAVCPDGPKVLFPCRFGQASSAEGYRRRGANGVSVGLKLELRHAKFQDQHGKGDTEKGTGKGDIINIEREKGT
jgi:hypothetical protein